MSFCDLDGDGKVTPQEELDTYMMMRMAAKAGRNGSSGGYRKPGSGCIGPIFVFGVCFILIIAGIGSCASGCRSYYPPAFPSYTYSSSESSTYSSTPQRNNSAEQQPTSSRSKSSSKSNSKSSSRSKSSEEFDMDDFADAEDFYEWYKDDFIDYEDAEEYYEEHDGGLR